MYDGLFFKLYDQTKEFQGFILSRNVDYSFFFQSITFEGKLKPGKVRISSVKNTAHSKQALVNPY